MRNMMPEAKPNVVNNQQIKAFANLNKESENLEDGISVSEILSTEGCETFSDYVKELGLANDPNLVVLSSQHHYYYDSEEMKDVRTVISLKVLNEVKEIKSFLHSIFSIIQQNSNFIGCFVDNTKVNGYELRYKSSSAQNNIKIVNLENGIVSQIPFLNMLYSYMDLKINRFISAKSVLSMLEENGFKVLGLKEINGLTYFHSQKVGSDDQSGH
jgi:hypothetical protein